MILKELTPEDIFTKLLEKTNQKSIIENLLPLIQDYDYAIIGGAAVAFYSKNARIISPEDLDIAIISKDKEFIKRDLIDSGFGYVREHMFDGNYWMVFKYKNQDIDVALAYDPVLETGVLNAQTFSYHGIKVKVIDKLYLITNKLLAGRAKDHRDIVYLLKTLIEDPNGKEETKKLVSIIRKYALERYDDFLQLWEDAKTFDNSTVDSLYI